MSNDFHWLLKMNNLARRYGDGLKPELAALLLAETPPGTTPLPARMKSAGPAEQASSVEERRAAEIVELVPRPSLTRERRSTRG
ncbi:MAG: hypothetical protein ACU0DW_05875 [Shimia sp.]